MVDVVLPSVEAPAPKPDPRIFEIAARRLGVSPGQLLHVGDSETEDLTGILQSGGQGILLNRKETTWRSNTLQSLHPLPDFLGNR